MSIVKYDPSYSTRDIGDIFEEESYLSPLRMFDFDFARPSRFLSSLFGSYPSYWAHNHDPAVNIYETDSAWIYMVELPGVKESDVRLECENGYLKLSAERKFDSDEHWKGYHRRELCEGKFERYFRLHEGSKIDGIKASLKDGILNITVPKEEQRKSKLIDITIS